MFTASQKKKENVAEYLLYMWQIEDLIRAHGMDLDKIDANIISKHTGLTDEQLRQMRDWYESLIDMMHREGVEKSGHLQLNKNTLGDLESLSRKLLADPKYANYAAEFYRTLPYIVELRTKQGEQKAPEIETCFMALYGVLMLRLQGKEISAPTLEAATQISKLLALLASYYKKDYNNELFGED